MRVNGVWTGRAVAVAALAGLMAFAGVLSVGCENSGTQRDDGSAAKERRDGGLERVVVVRVTTAEPLSDAQRGALGGKLRERLNEDLLPVAADVREVEVSSTGDKAVEVRVRVHALIEGDVETARRVVCAMLQDQGELSFRFAAPPPHPDRWAAQRAALAAGDMTLPDDPDRYRWFPIANPMHALNWSAADLAERDVQTDLRYVLGRLDGELYMLLETRPQYVLLAGSEPAWSVQRTAVCREADGYGWVDIHLDDPSKRLEKLTKRGIGRVLAVLIDDRVLTAPSVESEVRKIARVTLGAGDDARALAARLMPPILPVPAGVSEVEIVTPGE
jgi:preprotein translocase subunit SecD